VEFSDITMMNGQVIEGTSLVARGAIVGIITFSTQPMTDCVIPEVCFTKLGGACEAREKDIFGVRDKL
jgi:hypothetical protein